MIVEIVRSYVSSERTRIAVDIRNRSRTKMAVRCCDYTTLPCTLYQLQGNPGSRHGVGSLATSAGNWGQASQQHRLTAELSERPSPNLITSNTTLPSTSSTNTIFTMASHKVTVQFANVQTGKNIDLQIATNGSAHNVYELLTAAGSDLVYVTEIQLLAGRENVTAVVLHDGKQIAKLDGNADNVANIEKTSVKELGIQATKAA
ncbi:uncharacterized protein LTR77_007171 [Saxophila tyrrhenica]|uniref:Uncharacterized protein n=1 Tax=Saxophila tyrrhenica TaxID=1690608 RepID=A0AAV9P4F2_9PEZI|nr:hypothetical protein LTR77_007171 [Saxophila tyrrhenica]